MLTAPHFRSIPFSTRPRGNVRVFERPQKSGYNTGRSSMYRLLALDLDGTLLNSGLRLSEVNGEAVRAAMERGVQVVLATARFYGIALRTASRLGLETPLICSNGALVKRPSDGRELIHLQLDHDLAFKVTTLGDERGWEMFTT